MYEQARSLWSRFPPHREHQISSSAGHWQELWSDPEGTGQVMGGAGADVALEALWSTYLKAAGFAPGDLVLDIACGAAPIARFREALPPTERPLFVCVDYALAALQSARRRFRDGVLCAASDARRLPFAGGGFAAVVSQFGLEYAGHEAFAAAADRIGAGGSLCAVIHAEGGVIAAECAENARLVDAALNAGLVEAARASLKASYATPRRAASSGYVNKKKEAALDRALREARLQNAVAPSSNARDLIARYAADIERLAARRFAFAPDDALGWLASVETRLEAYRARMNAMLEAALSGDAMKEIHRLLQERGMIDIGAEPVFFRAGEPQGAWRLTARKSA